MATLKEYYNNDFNGIIRVTQDFSVIPNMEATVNFHLDSNTKFVSFYIPNSTDVISVIKTALNNLNSILFLRQNAAMENPKIGEVPLTAETSRFSGRIFFYCENLVDNDEFEKLKKLALNNDLHIHLRDKRYAIEKSKVEVPLAFISHDSRDKATIAGPIVTELIKLACPVWYDEFSLKIGDNLRESIEKGIKECKKCVLILSPNFLGNNGWTKTEFNSVFTRELIEETNIILPVWCGIQKKELYEYSPSLVNKLGVNFDSGINNVAYKLRQAIVSE